MERSSAPRRTWSLLLCLLTACLFNCGDETINYFEEEVITFDAGLGQLEAYDALEVDYLTEVNFRLNKTSFIDDGCSTYTNQFVSKTITMTFGTCKDPTPANYFFGRLRSGKMLVSYGTVIGDTLSSRTITFDNYYVNAKKLEGQIDLGQITLNTIDTLLHAVCKFTNFKVLYPDGTSITFNGTQERVWTSGIKDKNPLNNTYTINSLADSLTTTGPQLHTVRSVISKPLKLNFSCAIGGNPAAGSGAVTVTSISDFADQQRTVDFGDGSCDNAITVITTRRTYPTSVN